MLQFDPVQDGARLRAELPAEVDGTIHSSPLAYGENYESGLDACPIGVGRVHRAQVQRSQFAAFDEWADESERVPKSTPPTKSTTPKLAVIATTD